MLSQKVSESIGFDFNSGRRDSSVHPFLRGPIPLTSGGLLVTMNPSRSAPCFKFNAKPAMEHTNRDAQKASPSTSRKGLWLGNSRKSIQTMENQIGRSLEFCEWVIPLWREFFPGKMDDVTPEMLWRSVNQIQPSFIRTNPMKPPTTSTL